MLRPYRSAFPRIDPSAFVDTSAQVIGDVEVGPESSIWYAEHYVRYRLDYLRESALT